MTDIASLAKSHKERQRSLAQSLRDAYSNPRWTVMEAVCLALREDDDVADLMLSIAARLQEGEYPVESLQRLDEYTGLTYFHLDKSPTPNAPKRSDQA
jgi:hypothetical protein